ncbi:MAG: TIGR04255 family protein [Deltaproteobacteria bacterium]|nr:TIGR04255 family protein [Deltaproteobacteria bacterium]
MESEYNPITGSPPEEVPLKNAPLVRVIIQVRFPVIASIVRRDFIGPFQEAIRATYPILNQEKVMGIVVGPRGGTAAPEETIWRFAEEAGNWRVSLAPNFVALETSSYTSRSDFIGKFKAVAEALNEHIDPRIAARLGMRYIDRITDPNMDDIENLVRKEMLGILSTSMFEHIQHSLSETVFAFPNSDNKLLARWGCVPPKGTVDPNAIEPVDQKSWILDLDMFNDQQRPFDPNALASEAHVFAERLYTFFRWAVKKEFLKRYGGGA